MSRQALLGAGVVPFLQLDSTVFFVFGRERYVRTWPKGSHKWSGFEGGAMASETAIETACREFDEESLSCFDMSYSTLKDELEANNFALAITTTIGVSDELEPSSAAGRCFTVLYSLSTFVALPLLLNVAANGVARVGLTLWGAVAGYQLTRDPTLRHQRRLGCVLVILILHVLLFGGLMGYALTFLAPSYWESVYYAYMALSSIGVDSTVPHTPAAVAYVAYYVLAGLGLLTLVAEDVYGLYCVYKAYLDDEEELPESPRLLRRDSSQIEGRSLNWVLGTVYNVLNLPRRLSAQALATATTNPLRP